MRRKISGLRLVKDFADVVDWLLDGPDPGGRVRLALIVTPRPTDSTREVENLSDKTEELCSNSFFPDLCNTYLELSAVMPVQCCLNRIEP